MGAHFSPSCRFPMSAQQSSHHIHNQGGAAAMKTLADAAVANSTSRPRNQRVRPKELRVVIRGYANAQRELIEAVGELDRPLQLAGPSRRRPKLVVVR